jgi:AraC-like DNA-binding protein
MMELTPKYLTELSNQVTGRPASNWIDYYAARLLRKELSAKDVPFTDIAEKMKFSSLPAFSRYVKRVLGCSPTEYRESLKHKGKLY